MKTEINEEAKPLTKREKQAILHLMDGKSRKMIAAHFVISIRTLDTHLKNAHFKTNTSNIAGLVKYGFENKSFITKILE